MVNKPKSILPESCEPKRVKTWSTSQNQFYPSLVSQNESKHGQQAKINYTRVLWAKKSQNMVNKPKSIIPESYRPFVPGHSEPKRVKTWSTSQNQWYSRLIGLSYQVTASQNESKHGQQAKINYTRVLSAFRTRSQWAKTSQNMVNKPKSMLPESGRPFVPGHSELKLVKTWPRRQNQCYPSLVGLSYQVTVCQNESKPGQQAKNMYLKCPLNRRHETRIIYRDTTQVLIYYQLRAGNIWSKDILHVYAKHVFFQCSYLCSPNLYLLLNVTQRPHSFWLCKLTTEINWLMQWHSCENLEKIKWTRGLHNSTTKCVNLIAFCGPCIAIYWRNKDQQDLLSFLNSF
jgi:hypothetical protein